MGCLPSFDWRGAVFDRALLGAVWKAGRRNAGRLVADGLAEATVALPRARNLTEADMLGAHNQRAIGVCYMKMEVLERDSPKFWHERV